MDKEFIYRLSMLGVPSTFVDVFWKQAQKLILNAKRTKLMEPALIISDIHGNLPALNLALDFSKDQNIRKLISLGDMVDYNEYNNEVLNTILNYNDNSVIIRGNHDSFFKDNDETFQTKIDQQKIDSKLVEKVKLLNAVEILEINGLNLLICHSNPWCLDSFYIFPNDSSVLDYFLFNIPLDGFIYGHTHIANFYSSKNKIALNPGSLGQSRGKTENLTFAWLLPGKKIVKFFGIVVDKKKPTLILDEEPYLIKEIPFDPKKEINFVH